MPLPSIDLASLPDLSRAVALFGSLADHAGRVAGDDGVSIMVYLYEDWSALASAAPF